MSRVAGITVEGNEITIRPYTDPRLGFAKGTYRSPAGEICSAWEYENGKIRFDVEIPTNARATVILPGGEVHKVSTGSYTYYTDQNN